jgi:peroxiredoxin Q/BCP
LAVVVVAVVGLYFLSSFHHSSAGTSGAAGSSAYPYAVGSPGLGQQAPNVNLPASTGGSFDLASYRGQKPVLLYFQEGLTCQPCWDQISVIQKDEAKFRALGIGPIVSITTDPLGEITQKAHDQGLTIPVLSDEGGRVSDSYSARDFGMMGHDRDGHTFVLVGKDGKILWRADYGGAPKYTMFVPVNVLLAQLKARTGGTL